MLGLITLVVIGIYVGLVILLPKTATSPRNRLLIRLAVLSPVIWVVGNGLVGYAWFRLSCATEAKLVVFEQNLPPARVLRLTGSMADGTAAENLLTKFPKLQAIEATASQDGAAARPRPGYSRFELGPLKADSWPGRPQYERREAPLDVVERRPGGPRVVAEGKSDAQYLLDTREAEQGMRQSVFEMRLMRPDGRVVATDKGILYLWMDSNLVPFGAPSQDSSRCRYDAIASKSRLIELVAR